MNAKLGKTTGMSGWVKRGLGLGALVLAGAACGGGSAEPSAPVETAALTQRATVAPIGKTIWLRAGTNGRIVSADRNLHSNAPLVANRDAAGGWEQFVVASAGGDYISLRVVETGAYVSADPSTQELTGFRTAVGEWEQFLWQDFGNGTIGLKAKSTGKYVVADSNRGGNVPLFADRATAGQWESFSWGTTSAPSGGWVQIWSDEFDGTSINTSNWAHNTGVHVNNEQQQYTSSSENVQVSNGTLKLIARYKPTNGYPYTSGRLESAGKREFSHGAVEARIKLPVGAGLWPAFWMLGNDIGSKGWPACGELDIMENVGYGNWTSGALHGPGYSGNTPITGQFNNPFNNNPVSNWHTYRTEYSPSDIKWFIDGTLVKTTAKAEVTRYGAYVYDHPFYIILNLAVGGGYPQGMNGATSPYPGVPQSTADLIARTPQVMEVDYVRAFQWR